MKKTSLLCPLILAASLFTTPPASATVPSPLVLQFTYWVQVSEEVDENDIFRGEVEAFRLDSKSLLKLLALETGMVFPKGAKIIVDPDGDCFVVDKHGDLIVDVTEFLFADFGDSLFDGFFNIETEHEKSNIFIAFSLDLSLPDEDLLLEIFGVAKEKFSASKPKNNGNQTSKGNIHVDVTGRGSLDEELILGEGTIQLKGKETETVKK
jgi:hypothetical protein